MEHQNLHHVIPLKLGGSNSLNNLVILTDDKKEQIDRVFQPLLEELEKKRSLFREYLDLILKIKSANVFVKQQLDEVFNQYSPITYSVISKHDQVKNRNRFRHNKKELRKQLINKYLYQLQGMHLHHIIPISRGGPNSDWNLIPVTKEVHVKIHKNLDHLFFSYSTNNNNQIINEEEFEELFPQNQ
jgi:5-methylcytosine-specific restriction endonuclease McrA